MRTTLLLALGLALGINSTPAQTNPVQVATQARFDLIGDLNTGPLTNGYMITGDSPQISRQTWITNTDQPRSYTVSFNIVHFAWSEAAFSFTPASNGIVTMTLFGPWEVSPAGPIYRQDVLWDALSATNTTLPNGSFETASGGVPAGWTRPYGDGTVVTGPVPPVDGTNYAKLWQNGPFTINLPVTGGLPVSLHFFARAYFPTNLIDLTPIAGTNTPAHIAARRYMRGVNLSGWLDAPPGQDWGSHYTARDFSEVRAEGFDHVRLPIAWNYYTGPSPACTLSNNILSNADFLVTNSLQAGLNVLIDIHNFDELCTNFSGTTNKFYAIWEQLAAHYSNSPPQVAFELDNEPNGGATTVLLNPVYAEVIRRIRLTNPGRTIFVAPGQWDGISELGNLLLPDSDSNLVVTVHCYDPFYFTHQGANWAGPDPATLGVLFPGPPPTPITPAAGIGDYVTNWFAEYNTLPAAVNPSSPIAFQAELKTARQWSDFYGRPVHVGEFGAYTMADPVSRVNFYRAFRSTVEALGLGWAMWDWKGGFKYWDDATGQPFPGMRDAMFPPPQLLSTAAGQIQCSSAAMKTLVVQRAPVLATAPDWINLQTQTLSGPQFNFADPAAGQTNAAYYRILWLK
jgi:endoglucanase